MQRKTKYSVIAQYIPLPSNKLKKLTRRASKSTRNKTHPNCQQYGNQIFSNDLKYKN